MKTQLAPLWKHRRRLCFAQRFKPYSFLDALTNQTFDLLINVKPDMMGVWTKVTNIQKI